ncbi:hypothetical protein [Streptomyces sp. NBC_01233]|uniref:hypothetical protein n=1 Tax=Streptomyces sp. NBC_01233 TaxID=2903787 RepID=UPI002E1339DD|nr:hypothetical protein OG332_40950 [Streptomyces sp. NBC_01233]
MILDRDRCAGGADAPKLLVLFELGLSGTCATARAFRFRPGGHRLVPSAYARAGPGTGEDVVRYQDRPLRRMPVVQ